MLCGLVRGAVFQELSAAVGCSSGAFLIPHFKAKAIIRTGIGSQRPLHPQHQHIGDFTDMVRKMCSSLDVIKLNEPEDIFPSYEKALNRDDGRSTILVDFVDYHNEK